MKSTQVTYSCDACGCGLHEIVPAIRFEHMVTGKEGHLCEACWIATGLRVTQPDETCGQSDCCPRSFPNDLAELFPPNDQPNIPPPEDVTLTAEESELLAPYAVVAGPPMFDE